MFRYYWQLLNLLTGEIHEVGRGIGYASTETAEGAARRFVARKWPDVECEDIVIRIWRGPKELRHKTECIYEGRLLNMRELENVIDVEELSHRDKTQLAMLVSKLKEF